MPHRMERMRPQFHQLMQRQVMSTAPPVTTTGLSVAAAVSAPAPVTIPSCMPLSNLPLLYPGLPNPAALPAVIPGLTSAALLGLAENRSPLQGPTTPMVTPADAEPRRTDQTESGEIPAPTDAGKHVPGSSNSSLWTPTAR